MTDPAVSSPAAAGPATGRRRKIAARTRLDFWFDVVLFLGYTLAYSYGFTGIAVHEWLGIGLGIALLLHLTLHWDWVIRTTAKLLRPRGHDKVIWLVNLALLVRHDPVRGIGHPDFQGCPALPRYLHAGWASLDQAAHPHGGSDAWPRPGARGAALEMDCQRRAQAADEALSQAARMKFLRHLAAVTLVVAVVVVIGLAWNHFAGSTLGSGSGFLTVARARGDAATA